MKLSFRRVFVLLLLFIPIALVYKNLFLPGPFAWGDAPYFFPEALKELIREPLSWTGRGVNFGGVNLLLWLSPLMFLYGALGSFLNLGNDVVVKLIFYLPAIILSVITPILLTRYLKLSKKVQFFSSLFYSLNTYFILLIDGGQVGVALAYGLFPLTLLFLRKSADRSSSNNFFLGLLLLFIQGVADPRVALICLFTVFLWVLIGRKNVLQLIVIFAAWLATSAYWIYPLLKNGYQNSGIGVSNLNFITLLNSLVLFQPHFPGNEFGKLLSPPFYFVGVPLLIFGGLIFVPRSGIRLRLTFLFLILAFIAKGSNAPFGGWYQFLATKTLFGFAFRDSSKFFIPLMLFGGILIGNALDRFKSYRLRVAGYIFILFLVAPAILGKMNFVLSNRKHSQDYQTISQNLKKDEALPAGRQGFYRTVWFPEKYPIAYETLKNPAIEANTLVNGRPFAAVNASEDVFNFLYNPGFVEWFRVLGIKYVILSGDPRNITPTQKDTENWEIIKDLVGKTPGLEKKDWGTSVPVYEVDNIRPKMFAVDQLTAVVGPEPLVSSSLPFTAVYFEDGKFDPLLFEGLKEDSVKILFNGKEELDMTMSFLQKYFVGYSQSGWANYESSEYLKYKYQLLIRGIAFRDFDYGKGISFSTEKGEKIEYNLKTDKAGEYILAVRSWGENIKLDFEGNQLDINSGQKDNFSWYTKQVSLKTGSHKLSLENQDGTQIVNVAALIPIAEWTKAEALTKTYLTHFGTITENKLSKDWKSVEVEEISPVSYKITAPEDSYWIIFSDSYLP
ncbi:MAG: hypothetical protein Q8P91_00110 [bacterium]|nr:hypothetical protein [bacterium]